MDNARNKKKKFLTEHDKSCCILFVNFMMDKSNPP